MCYSVLNYQHLRARTMLCHNTEQWSALFWKKKVSQLSFFLTVYYFLYLISLSLSISASSKAHQCFKSFSSQAGLWFGQLLETTTCKWLKKRYISVWNNCLLRWCWYWLMCSADYLFICWQICKCFYSCTPSHFVPWLFSHKGWESHIQYSK